MEMERIFRDYVPHKVDCSGGNNPRSFFMRSRISATATPISVMMVNASNVVGSGVAWALASHPSFLISIRLDRLRKDPKDQENCYFRFCRRDKATRNSITCICQSPLEKEKISLLTIRRFFPPLSIEWLNVPRRDTWLSFLPYLSEVKASQSIQHFWPLRERDSSHFSSSYSSSFLET